MIVAVQIVATLPFLGIAAATGTPASTTGAAMAPTAAQAPADRPATPTPVEAFYSDRAGTALALVGYGPFDSGAIVPAPPPGRLPDGYRLGPGDGVTVVLDGNLSGVHAVTVDRSGAIALPGLGVLPAAGLTVAEFRDAVQAEATARLVTTRVHATVTDLRQVAILVAGAVARPGRHAVAARTGVLDALIAAGGVDRSGSLREVRLVREGESLVVDVFALVDGTGEDPPLDQGDRIVVPPLGPTVAAAGAVIRPGIFELPSAGAAGGPPVIADLLDLAGGPLPGGSRISLWRFDPNGRETVQPIGPADATLPLAPGDLIVVERRTAGIPAAVSLEGHVDAPGRLPLADALSLSAVLGDGEVLRTDAYRLFAAIETTDPRTGARGFRAFSPAAVIGGRLDRPLMPDDRVVVLSATDVAFLGSTGVLTVLSGDPPSTADRIDCPGLAAIDLAARAGRGPPAGAMLEAAGRLPPRPLPCPEIFRRHPDLLVLALSQAVLVGDGAARPGLYPVAEAVPVAELMALAGTAGGAADDARALAASSVMARPGDVVAVETATVRLIGAVRVPGRRALTPGLTLAGLLADGAMAEADLYPLIAVVDRRVPGSLRVERRVVAPADVLAGADVPLADGDTIRLFSRAEVEDLATGRRTAARGAVPEVEPETVAGAGADTRAASDGRTEEPALDPATAVFVDGHAISVTGAVARPGNWPVAGPVSVSALLDVAGQALPGARLADAEATMVGDTGAAATPVRRVRLDLEARSPDQVSLRPGDALHIPPRTDPLAGRTVEVAGAVRHPGSYTLVEGDRLSSLIARAGGLAADAYPLGAVFTRRSAAEAERAYFRERATAIRRALAEAMAGDRPPDGAAVTAAQTLIAALEEATPSGRLQVEADPERLSASPGLDIVLQDGDRLEIPVRPLTVRVTGEVMAPAALQFRDGRTVGDYLRGAGGSTSAADTGRVLVVLPDGQSVPVRPSPWNHDPVPIPPGATIVVPRDPNPFRFLAFADGIATLLGRLALGAVAVTGLVE